LNVAKAKRKKAKELPKGLAEFGSSLGDPRWAKELLPRLLDLPENGLRPMVERHAEALKAVEEAEKVLSARLKFARELAEETFRAALKNWTIKEVQEATGYDDE
jgi:hypothetical protein